MAVLRISLLGPFTAALDETPLESKLTTKAKALLITLAMEQGRAQRRERLFTLLWPGMPEKSARHNLSQVLYELRQVGLGEPKDQPLLLADRVTVQLHPQAEIEVDVQQLDSLFQRTKSHSHTNLPDCETCIQALGQAIALYRGDFLADFYLEDSNEFEEWAEAEREKRRGLILEAIDTFAVVRIDSGDHQAALNILERGIAIDDLKESFYRQKMEAYTRSGRRVEALRQYREYARRLDDELGVGPSREIAVLYERIQREEIFEKPEQEETTPKEVKRPRHNLPPQLTPFIGREEELEKLDVMLVDPNIRLITITGPGGMGKTRLAIACAERQLQARDGDRYLFPDGVYFVPLADIEEVEYIPHVVAQNLSISINAGHPGGMKESKDIAFENLLIDYLRNKQILLVLDNFEQLTEGVDFLIVLLSKVPGIQLLVTSRELLHLQAEQVFYLTGLDYPSDASEKHSGNFSAVQLFLERGRRVRQDFKLNQGDLQSLTKICRLLGGMPLGLELAASWVHLMSVDEIVREVSKGTEILVTDAGDLAIRHRSLRAVCASTLDWLDEEDRNTFTCLSVFRGGFSREAAKEVSGASILTMKSFQEKSLIHYNPNKKRYHIHPYLRKYCLEQLLMNPELEYKVQGLYCAYFANLMEKLMIDYDHGQVKKVIYQIDNEILNVMQSLYWAFAEKRVPCIDSIMSLLFYYYEWYQRIHDTITIFQEANLVLHNMCLKYRNLTKPNPDYRIILCVHAKILNFLGYRFKYGLNNVLKAVECIEESAKLIDELERQGFDARKVKAQNLRYKGFVCERYDVAKVFFQQSISLSDAVEDEYGMLESCLLAGWQASSVGQFVEEKEWYEQGLALSRKVENPWAENIALINYGVVLQRLGSYEAADEALKDAILKSNIFENELSLALALFEVGCLYLSLGHLETAIDSLAHSIEISEEYGLLIRLRSLACLTWVLWHSGRFKDAEYAIKNVIKTDVRSVFNQNYFDAYITWLELLVLTGCYQAAREEILRIDNVMISKQYKFNDWQGGYINFVQGLLAVEKKDYSSAKKFMQDCWDKVSVFIPHVNRFQFIYALIAFEEGNFEQFKIIVINALKTSIENQDYMSMINHLPLTLILLEGKNREFELEIFKKVMCDPFLGKAQLFHDLVYNHLPEKIRSIEVEMVETSPEHREELWAVARKVLESWRDS